MEAVASLFGRTAALRQAWMSPDGKGGKGTSLDAHVRGIMRTMKERLSSVREGPLQARDSVEQLAHFLPITATI